MYPHFVTYALSNINEKAAAFPIANYSGESIQSAFASIKSQWPESPLKVALWNAGYGIWKVCPPSHGNSYLLMLHYCQPFLELKPEEIQESVDTNIVAAFAFSREVITAFKSLDIDQEKGKRGTLIFTGATASVRGNTTTSAFAAGKFGIRALSQSLAKEFGKDNIHVAHAIIDGSIVTARSKDYVPAEKLNNPDVMLNPESIGNVRLLLSSACFPSDSLA